MNPMRRSLFILVALAASLALVATTPAADKSAPAAPAKKADAQTKNTRYPINGKLAAVDQAGKTFTLKGAQKDRVFRVNAQTRITKHGKTATLADAVVGEDVGGYVEKQNDGSVLALSVRFGAKPFNKPGDSGPAKKTDTKGKPQPPAAK